MPKTATAAAIVLAAAVVAGCGELPARDYEGWTAWLNANGHRDNATVEQVTAEHDPPYDCDNEMIYEVAENTEPEYGAAELYFMCGEERALEVAPEMTAFISGLSD